MLSRLGMIVIFIGVMMADSENLLIPLGVVAIGIAMVMIGTRRDENGENQADH